MQVQSSRPMAHIEAATRARAAAVAQADRNQQYRQDQERVQERRAQDEKTEERRQQQAVVNTQGQSTGRLLNTTA